MYDLNAARAEMRELFRAVFPDRSMDAFEEAISTAPKEAVTPKQQEEWLLEMAKMAIVAENKLHPADGQKVAATVAKIDEMVIHLNTPLSDEEFLELARKQYGSRGVQGAKKLIADLDEHTNDMSAEDKAAYRQLMMEIWIDSKEEAHTKFTPKKYQK